MKKLILTLSCLGIVFLSNAQFKIDKDYPTAGIKIDVDTAAAQKKVVVNFNTDKGLTLPGVSAQKAQTQRGVYVKVYNELGAEVSGVDGKCNNHGSNGNPIHISDASAVMNFYTVDTVPAWSTAQNFWKPAACVFDVDPSDLTNQAFGAYPGIYKKVDYRFYFDLAGFKAISDVEFDIMTLTAGNTGKTAKYKLMVSIGTDKTSISSTDGKTPDYSVVDFYTTGSGLKHVKLAEAIGVDPSVFTNKKVYIALYTDGTGDYIQHGKYDPVIVFDNFSANIHLPAWIQPQTGIAEGMEVNNVNSPLENILVENNDLIFPLYAKVQDRVGTLTITSDIESALHATKDFSFLPSLGVKAKDAQGKYTIDVAYTHTPDVLTGSNWSKEKIVIDAPEAMVNDDLCIYLKYVKKDADIDGKIISDKFEMNCGVVSRNTFYGKINLNPSSLQAETQGQSGLKVYADQGRIFVLEAISDVNIYNLSGQLLKVVSPESAENGINIGKGAYLVNVGRATEKIIVN